MFNSVRAGKALRLISSDTIRESTGAVTPMAGRVGRYSGLCLRIAVAFIVLAQCHAQDVSHQNVVARIGDRHTITFAELGLYVHDYQYTYKYRKYPTGPFEKALDDMIVGRRVLPSCSSIHDHWPSDAQVAADRIRGYCPTPGEEACLPFLSGTWYT